MKALLFALYTLVALLALAGCKNVSGLSAAPRATFAQLACLDVNNDNRLNDQDASDPKNAPDFNGDRKHDENDAAFLKGLNIPLGADRDKSICGQQSKEQPEYLVAHGYFHPANVSCEGDNKAVLVLGVGGGVANVKDLDDAAGVRSIMDGLMKAYDKRDVQTIGVVAGPVMVGAENGYSGMEDWVTHAVRVYLQRYPCLKALLVGHSHGSDTIDVVGARLEGEFAGRFVDIVDVDRIEALYGGDTRSRPSRAPVFNIFETNDGVLKGSAYNSPNARNWDASDQQAPEKGDHGGKLVPANHTTIDNSEAVKTRIIDEELRRFA